MRYFANPSVGPVREAMTAGKLSMIATPKQRLTIPEGAEWCADNGCFGKGYPGDEGWLAWLDRFTTEQRERCLFATAPDVVGDAAATLKRSSPWLPRIRALGYPAAFVAQDGSEAPDMVPWDAFDVLFIGGSTEWKLGAAAADLVRQAKDRGKLVHMGRVNSLKRLRYAASIGCDTADGTYITYGPSINFPRVMAWLGIVNGTMTKPEIVVTAVAQDLEANATTFAYEAFFPPRQPSTWEQSGEGVTA